MKAMKESSPKTTSFNKDRGQKRGSDETNSAD